MNLAEIKQLNPEEKEVEINKYKTKIEQLSNLFAPLKVPYNDINVLLKETPELKLVNDFFKSISCKDKGIETLLYEMIGYSLAKTAKLNKSFLLKRKSAEIGKSVIFRIIEALIGNQSSHEHLENLCGTKAGSKTTIEKLIRTYCKYC